MTHDMIDLVRVLENSKQLARKDAKAVSCIQGMIETAMLYYDLQYCEGCNRLFDGDDLISQGWSGNFCEGCAPNLFETMRHEKSEAGEDY